MKPRANTKADIQYILPATFHGFRVLETGNLIGPNHRVFVSRTTGVEWMWVGDALPKLINKPYNPRKQGVVIIQPFRIRAILE